MVDPNQQLRNIFLDYDHYFYMKKIEIYVPEFFKHNNSSVASVISKQSAIARVSLLDKLLIKWVKFHKFRPIVLGKKNIKI